MIPFQFNTEQTYVLIFEDQSMRVVMNGGLVMNGAVPVEITTPYLEAQLPALGFVQSADVLFLVHPSHAPRKLSRTAHHLWTLAVMTFAPSIPAPTGITVTPKTSGAETYHYRVTANKQETLEESLPGTGSTSAAAKLTGTDTITIAWNAVAGAVNYNVYRQVNGIDGLIGTTEATSFTDDNLSPAVGITPPKARNPFSGAGNYPGSITLHDQRAVYGNSLNAPSTIWMSRSGNYENMTVSSPVQDDDAITVTLASRQVNAIRSMVSMRDLVVLTSGGEWTLGPGSGEVMTPTSLRFRPQSFHGSSPVPPLVIGDTVLFVQDKGSVIRNLGYRFESDGYTGSNLSLLASHLFEGRAIQEWTFAQAPHAIVWAVRDDGILLGLTFNAEQEVVAWHRHDTEGTFESVCSVSEGSEDAVYFVIRRTVNGATRRFVERLETRFLATCEEAFFVDCGLSRSGDPVTTVSGLDHLEGKSVIALADGNVVPGLSVAAGSVTLPQPAGAIHVGLPFTTDIETLNLDLPLPGGTIQGRKKRISAVTLRLEKSRGVKVGPTTAQLVEMKERHAGEWDTPIPLFTGDRQVTLPPSWDSNGRVCIRQDHPLPLSLLAIIPEVDLGS
ncbi:MAG: hypothetical protein HQL59_09295 [Magnetococcales bacterium]|nr:hypothetical protein [Magnetococcales bacterium]